MPRLMLTDEFWPKLEKILLQEAIYNKRNLRMTVEGMLYRMRVGCPWRNLTLGFWMLEFHLQKIQCLVIE
ncbi:Putative transposase of IS4/5 family [Nitrosomonas sp. Nm166]|nr:Putative transposase of IS4/5 family [Nitrosomonas sp. Nm166]